MHWLLLRHIGTFVSWVADMNWLFRLLFLRKVHRYHRYHRCPRQSKTFSLHLAAQRSTFWRCRGSTVCLVHLRASAAWRHRWLFLPKTPVSCCSPHLVSYDLTFLNTIILFSFVFGGRGPGAFVCISNLSHALRRPCALCTWFVIFRICLFCLLLTFVVRHLLNLLFSKLFSSKKIET